MEKTNLRLQIATKIAAGQKVPKLTLADREKYQKDLEFWALEILKATDVLIQAEAETRPEIIKKNILKD